MDVQHDADVGVGFQILLHRLTRARVGAGIAGVVVDAPVVDKLQAAVCQNLRQLVADAHYVELRVLGAVCVRGQIAVQPRLGVGFAGVGVDNENLRPILRKADAGALPQHLAGVNEVARLVLYAHAALDGSLQHIVGCLGEKRFLGSARLHLRQGEGGESLHRRLTGSFHNDLPWCRREDDHVLHPPCLLHGNILPC